MHSSTTRRYAGAQPSCQAHRVVRSTEKFQALGDWLPSSETRLRPRSNQTCPKDYSTPVQETAVRFSNRVDVYQPNPAKKEVTGPGILQGEHHKSAAPGASAVPNASTCKGGQMTHDSRKAKRDCTCTAPKRST